MSMDGPDDIRVRDVGEETPNFDSIRRAQNVYEELLTELDRCTESNLQGGDFDDQIEYIKDDIRDTRSYIKVELQTIEPTDFIVGGNPEEYEEEAEELFGPELEFLESRFEAAEEYRDRLKERI